MEPPGDDSARSGPSRREWLAGVGITTLSVALAGCFDNSDDEGPAEHAESPSDESQTDEEEGNSDMNERLYAEPGEVQEMIDARGVNNSHGYNTRAKVVLCPSGVYSSDTEDLPIILRRGVTLDMNGADLGLLEDTDAFHFRPESQVKNGRVNYLSPGESYSSTIFDIDTARFDQPANIANHVRIHNVDTKGYPGNRGTVMYANADGGPVSGMQINGCVWHNCGHRGILVRNGNPDSWANGNWWSNMILFGGDTIIEFVSDEVDAPVNGNYFLGLPHPNNGKSEWLAQIRGEESRDNKFEIMAWDPHRFSEGLVRLSGNVKRNVFKNTMHQNIPDLDWVENKKWVDQSNNRSNAWYDDLNGRLY